MVLNVPMDEDTRGRGADARPLAQRQFSPPRLELRRPEVLHRRPQPGMAPAFGAGGPQDLQRAALRPRQPGVEDVGGAAAQLAAPIDLAEGYAFHVPAPAGNGRGPGPVVDLETSRLDLGQDAFGQAQKTQARVLAEQAISRVARDLAAATSIRRGMAFACLGIRISSTPWRFVALTLSASTVSGRMKRR